jgi:hypothetical protein
VSVVYPGGGRNGLQQDDGLLVDETQKSGSNNLYCGRMAGRSRLFNQPVAMVEQSVVAANRVGYCGRTVSTRRSLDRNREVAE